MASPYKIVISSTSEPAEIPLANTAIYKHVFTALTGTWALPSDVGNPCIKTDTNASIVVMCVLEAANQPWILNIGDLMNLRANAAFIAWFNEQTVGATKFLHSVDDDYQYTADHLQRLTKMGIRTVNFSRDSKMTNVVTSMLKAITVDDVFAAMIECEKRILINRIRGSLSDLPHNILNDMATALNQ